MGDNDVKLGYIGLGDMGAPMAKRLVDWPGGLTVFDVRPEAMTPLAEAGASLADSVADVAAADVISVTVLNDEQVRDVIAVRTARSLREAGHRDRDPFDDQRRPRPASSPSSCNPRAFTSSTRRSAVARVRPRRVSSPSWLAPTTTSTSGSSPLFKQWASLVVHAGEPGAGTRMKLARNMLTFISYAAAGEAMKLAEQGGYQPPAARPGRAAHRSAERWARRGHRPGELGSIDSPTTSSTARCRTPAISARRI